MLEYHDIASTSSARYSAVIRLLRWSTVETRLKQCFQYLSSALFPAADEEEDSGTLAERSFTAKEVFAAVFRGRPEFQGNDSIKTLLSKSTQLPFREDVRGRVLEWAYELYVEAKRGIADWTLYFETTAQLWCNIMPYTRGRVTDSRPLRMIHGLL